MKIFRAFAAVCILGLLNTEPVRAQEAAARNVQAQTIKPAGVTLALTQTMDWLDADRFALGRWDGTISVFRRSDGNAPNPVVVQAMSAPSGAGIEMLAALDANTIATSDGRSRIALWQQPDSAAPFGLTDSVNFDPAYGPANSGVPITIKSERYFVSGHESGHVLFWKRDGNKLRLTRAVDVRSPTAPSNPWHIHNVRGIQVWRGTFLVTGSEDGDLTGLDAASGREIFRVRYNPSAQRGINSVSVSDDLLLLANCAVGQADNNIWLYDLSSGTPVLKDAENLSLDLQRSQTFDFDALLAKTGTGKLEFFASTEEGLLWQGQVSGGQLTVTGVTKVGSEGAAKLALAPAGDIIATAAGSVRLFLSE